jgi:hypothetical protein
MGSVRECAGVDATSGSVIEKEPVGSGLSRETPSDKGAMKDARRKLALYKCREIIEATAIWQDEDGKDDH